MQFAEAERYVQELNATDVQNIGSAGWAKQRERLERLNVQAHANAQAHSEEFVKELLVLHGKVHTLVHDLLAVEAWKEHVLPRIITTVAESSVGHTQSYLAAHSEATIANLLEVSFFHQDACEAAGDDALVELVDWCFRKIAYLLSPSARQDALAGTQQLSAKEALALSAQDELQSKLASSRFAAASCSLTILRYLTGFLHSLPLGVMARLLDVHDAPINLVALLDQAPWLRQRNPGGSKGKVTEIFEGGTWTELDKNDRLRITNPQAQCWLALCNLVLDQRCRGRYVWDEQRQDRLQRIRRHFNEALFDQIPTLKELQRAVDEIMLNQGPQAGEVKQGRLVMEQVPEIRKRILDRSEDDWQEIADRQANEVFADTPETRKAAAERMESLTELFDAMAELGPEGRKQEDNENVQNRSSDLSDVLHSNGNPHSRNHQKSSKIEELSSIAEPSEQESEESVNADMEIGTVSLRALHRQHGRWREAACYQMRIPASCEPKRIEIGKGNDGIKGSRYKCEFVEAADVERPLPPQGQIEVNVRNATAAAQLDLPLVKSLKQDGTLLDADEQELPRAAWLTVGDLRKDGVVFQMKVRRGSKPSQEEKDNVTGAYYLYTPVSSFVTWRAD